MPPATRFLAMLAAAAALAVPVAAPAATRGYFIAAEEVVWDFAPAGAGLHAGGNHRGGILKPWARRLLSRIQLWTLTR